MNPASTLSRACARHTLVIRPIPSTVSHLRLQRSLSNTCPRPYAQPINLSSNTAPASGAEESSLAHDTLSRAGTDGSSQSPSPSPFQSTLSRTIDSRTSTTTSENHTSPFLLTGTVSRTGTMTHCVQITRQLQIFDKWLQKHYTRPVREKVHDPNPAGFLREGDIVEFGLFSEYEKEEKARRERERVERQNSKVVEVDKSGKATKKVLRGGRWKVDKRNKHVVRFVVRRVVTPFGVPIEERGERLGEDVAGKSQGAQDSLLASKNGNVSKQHASAAVAG